MRNKNLVDVPSCEACTGREKSLFCNLPQEELEKFSQNKGDNLFKKGQVIFYEGNRGHGVYCIFKGKVKIHKSGDGSKEQIVRFAKDGDVLGYRSLLGNEPYNATATAMEDSLICFIPKNRLMEALDSSQDLSFRMIKLLTSDLKESERKIINITQKPVIERIAEALLILKEKFGLKLNGVTLDVILTRREIGELAGVTTETTIRTLSDLNKQKIIHLNEKRIDLIDLPALVRIANLDD